ncbi:MAG: DUF1572 family protein, partial [Thermoanaerobaculia bacterium]
MDSGATYLEDAVRQFHGTKKLAERALAQVGDEDFFRKLDPDSNSLALIVKHLAGNMRSRWADFLTSDGEKPDRRRDSEFEIEGETRGSLMQSWEEGWRCVFESVGGLRPEDLLATVLIRTEPHTVVQAINRQLTHYAHHVGQIVFLAKHLAGPRW